MFPQGTFLDYFIEFPPIFTNSGPIQDYFLPLRLL